MEGHRDIVLSISYIPGHQLIATSSKDHTIRIWDAQTLKCLYIGKGHTDAVGAIGIPNRTERLVYSASNDCTLKCWQIPSKHDLEGDSVVDLNCKFTVKAHEKDINSIAISPNDRIIATSSQDKTIALWDAETGKLLRRLVGHKRGVWDIKFSPIDKCIVSASADKTIRLWSIDDGTCLKTLQGHIQSVLKVQFLTLGMQLLSVGGDGLLKLWTIKNDDCVLTLEAHQNKAWALDVWGDGEQVVTGGSDSTISIWKDVTLEVREKNIESQQQLSMKEQDLSNALQLKDYKKAVKLAFELDHPRCMLTVLKKMEFGSESQLLEIVSNFNESELMKCLLYIRDWNTNSKFCHISQNILRLIFQTHPPSEIQKCPRIKEILQGLIAYTDRHIRRLTNISQSSYLVDYTLRCVSHLGEQEMTDDKPIIKNKVTFFDTVLVESVQPPEILITSTNEKDQSKSQSQEKEQDQQKPQLKFSQNLLVSPKKVEEIKKAKPHVSGDSLDDDYIRQDYEVFEEEEEDGQLLGSKKK
eukprot:c16761_g1_i2.p1 GENE.c16761_g1_i2~~c16761_g1_i2.p1  ORF type:complete len:526 (-),score=242.24 c16761_g1_i2:201-1778(-)